jgi:RNA polymerase sigma-70 factor (ECF subfamily)
MERDELDQHLSWIDTHWTVVFQAHRGPAESATAAQRALMERYGGAIHRYLLGSLRDPDAADELAQEFAVRFLRGDFRNADPGRGRFRDFVKRAVYHLMVDHHRARQARPGPLADADVASDDPAPWEFDLDRRFLASWREQLMARAWAELDRVQGRTGQPFAAVLRLRAEEPGLRSPELALRLSALLGKPVTDNWVRQNLHRARDMFVDLLVREVGQSLADSSPERLREELEDLGLLEYCRPVLKRRGYPV